MKKIKNARERIIDSEVKKAYDKYKKYLSELAVYEQYIQENGPDKISKFKLLSLYIANGIEGKGKKNIEEKFRKFRDTIAEIKQKEPDIDLTDISTQKNRRIVSDIISETQNDENFKPADLAAVAVIENFVLYTAVGQVNDHIMAARRCY